MLRLAPPHSDALWLKSQQLLGSGDCKVTASPGARAQTGSLACPWALGRWLVGSGRGHVLGEGPVPIRQSQRPWLGLG